MPMEPLSPAEIEQMAVELKTVGLPHGVRWDPTRVLFTLCYQQKLIELAQADPMLPIGQALMGMLSALKGEENFKAVVEQAQGDPTLRWLFGQSYRILRTVEDLLDLAEYDARRPAEEPR
jgi:hypothetical protein